MTNERKNQIIDRKISQKQALLENYSVDLELEKALKKDSDSTMRKIADVEAEIKTLESLRQ